MDDANTPPMDRRSFLRCAAVFAAGAAVGCAHSQTRIQACRPRIGPANWSTPASTNLLVGQVKLSTLAFSETHHVDAHCHVFNVLDLPVDGFIRALAHGMGVPVFMDGAIQRVTGAFHEALVKHALKHQQNPAYDGSGEVKTTVIKWLNRLANVAGAGLNLADEAKSEEFRKTLKSLGANLESLADVIYIITRPRDEVAALLAESAAQISLFTPALVDYSEWINRDRMVAVGCSEVPPTDQIDVHSALMARVNAGELGTRRASRFSMLSFAPYNPLAHYRYDQLPRGKRPARSPLDDVKYALGIEEKKSRGFVGIKLYPSSGFLPQGNVRLRDLGSALGEALDDYLGQLFQFCVDSDVPIMAHANDSNGFGPDFAWRGSPWGWARVLSAYPKLRLNLGHMGFMEGIPEAMPPLKALSWAKRAGEDLMATQHNVYADLSNPELTVEAKTRDRFLGMLQSDLFPIRVDNKPNQVARRLMYGSDFWLNRLVPGTTSYYADFLAAFQNRFGLAPEVAQTAALASAGTDGPIDAPTFEEVTGIAFSEFKEQLMGRNALRFLGFLDDEDKADLKNQNRVRVVAYLESFGALPAWVPV